MTYLWEKLGWPRIYLSTLKGPMACSQADINKATKETRGVGQSPRNGTKMQRRGNPEKGLQDSGLTYGRYSHKSIVKELRKSSQWDFPWNYLSAMWPLWHGHWKTSIGNELSSLKGNPVTEVSSRSPYCDWATLGSISKDQQDPQCPCQSTVGRPGTKQDFSRSEH